MRCKIIGAEIGFDFDDAPRKQPAPLPTHQNFAQQVRPNEAWVSVIEGAGEGTQFHQTVWCGHSCPRKPSNSTLFGPRPPDRSQAVASYAAPFCASFNHSSTSSACPSGFTFSKICLILPSGPIMNVVRATPITFLPYMFFSWITPKALQIFLSASATSVKGRSYLSAN